MITEAKVRNFKCFSALRATGLSRVTLVGGTNGIGKSSFLEALFMFFDRLSSPMLLRHFAWRGMNKLTMAPEELFAPVFHNYATDEKIEISLGIDDHSESLSVEFDKVIPGLKTRAKEWRQRHKDAEVRIERLDRTRLTPYNFGLKVSYSPPTGVLQHARIVVDESGHIVFESNELEFERRGAVYLSAHAEPIEEDVMALSALDVKTQIDRVVKFLLTFE